MDDKWQIFWAIVGGAILYILGNIWNELRLFRLMFQGDIEDSDRDDAQMDADSQE